MHDERGCIQTRVYKPLTGTVREASARWLRSTEAPAYDQETAEGGSRLERVQRQASCSITAACAAAASTACHLALPPHSHCVNDIATSTRCHSQSSKRPLRPDRFELSLGLAPRP